MTTSAAILAALAPAALRGRLLPDHPLADLTWFRVGGPADVLFTPPTRTTSPRRSPPCRPRCP